MALIHTPEPKLGSRAHAFSLLGTDGRTHTLQSCRGPLGVLVMFICNHCPYVQAIRDRLVADMKDVQKTGVGVVAICAKLVQPAPWHRSIRYPVTPTLSLAGSQLRAICVPLGVALSVPGAVGGVVSTTAEVVAVATFE